MFLKAVAFCDGFFFIFAPLIEKFKKCEVAQFF